MITSCLSYTHWFRETQSLYTSVQADHIIYSAQCETKMWELTSVQKYKTSPFFQGFFLDLSWCSLFAFIITLLQAGDSPGACEVLHRLQGPTVQIGLSVWTTSWQILPPTSRAQSVRCRDRHLPLSPSHGGWATKMWLKPLPWDTYLAEGWAEDHPLDYVVSWSQGRLLSCPSLRPSRYIYLTLTLPVPVPSPMPGVHSGY